MNDTSGKFGNSTVDEDDFDGYGPDGTGFDEASGKGDICRYISAKGWVPGKWRLPTWKDVEDLCFKGQVVWSGSNWASSYDLAAPAGTSTGGDNAHGFWQPISGRFLGKGATAGDNKQCPAEGIVAFSAGGYRFPDGSAVNTGGQSFLWSGSSPAYYGQVNASGAVKTSYNPSSKSRPSLKAENTGGVMWRGMVQMRRSRGSAQVLV